MAAVWLRLGLQVFSATFASAIIGTSWYSKEFFGGLWWNYHFPGTQFGDDEAAKKFPGRRSSYRVEPLMMVLIVARSIILSLSMNALLPIVTDHSQYQVASIPLLFGLFLSLINGSVSLSHSVNSNEPIGLFLINVVHDALQLVCSLIIIFYVGEVL